MTRTITLQSHSGQRGYTGYGPTQHEVLPDSALIARMDGVTFAQRLDTNGTPVLLRGLRASKALMDLEVRGDTYLFDGVLPFQDGCSPTTIFFDEGGHIYREVSWGPALEVPFVFGPDGETSASIGWYSPSTNMLKTLVQTERDRWNRPIAPDIRGPLTRIAYTIFEWAAMSANDKPTIEILDEEAARFWFDPAPILARHIGHAEEYLRVQLDNVAGFAADAQALLDGGDVPGPSGGWTYRTEGFGLHRIESTALDRLVALRSLRDCLDREPSWKPRSA